MRADFVLTGAGRLVTCAPHAGEDPLGVIEGGAVAASGGEIVWVGPAPELRHNVELTDDAVEVDAGERVVLPGLVDCHTHLVFGGERSAEFAARLRGAPYDGGGVQTTVAATRAATDEDLTAAACSRLDRFVVHGVTTVEAKSGYGLTPANEFRLLDIANGLIHPVEVVPTFLGAHVVPDAYGDDPDAYVSLVCDEMIPALGERARFVDVWCDAGAFTVTQAGQVLEAGLAAGLGVKIHAEQLGHIGGAALAASLGATSADHLEHATWEDAEALAAAGTIGVLLPGASLMTGAPFAPARLLIERGVRIALSTDFNPGTSYSENLQLMIPLGCMHLGMTPEEAILGVTRHAAAAIGRERDLGAIQVGAAADLVILEAGTELDLAYHYGVNLVARVFKCGVEVAAGGATLATGTSAPPSSGG